MSAIETYTKTLLAPRLRKYGLNKDKRELVCADVRQRLASVLSHWHDESFRRTLLVLGREEAAFWEPLEASIEVRSLVVLCVRDSQIENLNAATRSQKQVLPDEEMPDLTREAISFFHATDLTHPPVAKNADMFGALPARFPNAWQALSVLANLEGAEATYELNLEKSEVLEVISRRGRPGGTTVVSGNGMDPGFDAGLRQVLSFIQKGEIRKFICSAFSRVTRNPAKLLAILEHVLRYGAVFVMPNYVLSGTYVAQRQPLIRPPHDIDEAELNQANRVGLTRRHQELLGLA